MSLQPPSSDGSPNHPPRRRLPAETVYSIVAEAVELEREFCCEALSVALVGMNSELMAQVGLKRLSAAYAGSYAGPGGCLKGVGWQRGHWRLTAVGVLLAAPRRLACLTIRLYTAPAL